MSQPWPGPGQPLPPQKVSGGIAGRSTGAKQPRSKLLLGCGGVVVACVLALLVAGALATYYTFSPGAQLPTTAVIGEKSTGALHFRDDPDDPALNEFIEAVADELQEADRRRKGQNLPENLRWMQQLQGQKIDANQLRLYVPRELTIALTGDGGGRGQLLVAANPGAFVRLAKQLLVRFAPQKPGVEQSYRGAELVQLGTQWVAFRGGTVLFGPELDEVKGGVDLLEAEAAGAAPSPLRQELQPLAERWHFSGVLRLPAKPLLKLLDRLGAKLFDEGRPAPEQAAPAELPGTQGEPALAQDETADHAEPPIPPAPVLPPQVAAQEAAVFFGLRVAGADRFTADLGFEADGLVVEPLRDRLERLLALAGASCEEEGLVLTFQEAHAERKWHLELTGIQAAIRRLLAGLPAK